MPPADDIFDEATKLDLTDLDQNPPVRHLPRERDIATGSSSGFGTGRITGEANAAVEATFYDDETEYLNNRDLNAPFRGDDDPTNDYAARITAVDATAYTYDARAIDAPTIMVLDVAPHTRPFSPGTINLTMAVVGDECRTTIMPDTHAGILCEVPETWGLELICD